MTDEKGAIGRALWAGLLSLLFPGVGQVFAGKRRLGWMLLCVTPAILLMVMALSWGTAPTPAGIIVFFLLACVPVMAAIGSAIDAFRHVRRNVSVARTRWWQSSWIAAAAGIALSAGTQGLVYSVGLGWRNFSIPSGSNIPTLMVGDIALVDVRMAGAMPAPGDMVVFKLPRDQRIDYVKRVVGVAGNRVRMRGGEVVINDRPAGRVEVGDMAVTGTADTSARYRETLSNGRSYEILKTPGQQPLDNTSEYSVPAGHFFVLGDNRDNSLDSRMMDAVGFVPARNMVGVAAYIVWAEDRGRILRRIE